LKDDFFLTHYNGVIGAYNGRKIIQKKGDRWFASDIKQIYASVKKLSPDGVSAAKRVALSQKTD
jgi:hypothetical protein